MDKGEFLNLLRGLFNIDGDLLTELTPAEQVFFVRDPVRFFISAGDHKTDVIWQELMRRQIRKETGV